MKTLEEQSQKNKGTEGKHREGEGKSQRLERDEIKISSILRLCKNFLFMPSCVFLPSVTDFVPCHLKLPILSRHSRDCYGLTPICSSPPERQVQEGKETQ